MAGGMKTPMAERLKSAVITLRAARAEAEKIKDHLKASEPSLAPAPVKPVSSIRGKGGYLGIALLMTAAAFYFALKKEEGDAAQRAAGQVREIAAAQVQEKYEALLKAEREAAAQGTQRAVNRAKAELEAKQKLLEEANEKIARLHRSTLPSKKATKDAIEKELANENELFSNSHFISAVLSAFGLSNGRSHKRKSEALQVIKQELEEKKCFSSASEEKLRNSYYYYPNAFSEKFLKKEGEVGEFLRCPRVD